MKPWTCRRQTDGKVCGHTNPSKKTMLCASCGKRRPPSKRPAHMAALDEFDYVAWVAEHGEVCGICGSPPKGKRRLDRDHEHKGSGRARGLLCAFPCNTGLKGWMTAEWLRAAADYLDRAAGRSDESEAA